MPTPVFHIRLRPSKRERIEKFFLKPGQALANWINKAMDEKMDRDEVKNGRPPTGPKTP